MEIGKSTPVQPSPGAKQEAGTRGIPSPIAAKEAKQAVKPITTEAVKKTEESAKVENEELQKAVEKINKVLSHVANGIEFSVDKDSGRTVVKIVDRESNTVLRQYPTEKTLAIAKDLLKMQGTLISETA